MSDSLRPPWTIARQVPLSIGFSRQEYWSGLPCPPPGDLPNPGIKPRSPALQGDSLLSEPPGRPKNTGVGSLSLLQGIFLTQGLNPGLLHGRWILYHLSHQGGPLAPSVYAQIKIHILARPMDSICKQSNFKAVILHLDF